MAWSLRLHTIPEEKLAELLEYCQRAQEKDPTFTFKEENSYVVIECPSRDNAFKRGVLFHSRFGCFFEVEWKY